MPVKRTLLQVITGVWGQEPEGDEDDYLVARVADFSYEELGIADVTTTRNIPELCDDNILREGDLLIEKSGGGDKQNVGRAVQWSGEDRTVCSNFIAILRPKPNVDSRWLVYLHRWLYLTGVASACTKQTTGIQNLDLNAYLRTPIQFPSLEQQVRIAYLLDRECGRARDLTKRLISLNESAQDLFTEDIRRVFDQHDHGQGPRLKDLGHWMSGGTPPRQDDDLWDGPVPWISAKDFQGRWRLREPTQFVTTQAAFRYSKPIEPGSVVVLSRGMGLVHGLSAAKTDASCCFNQDLRAVVTSPSCIPDFLVLAIRAADARLRVHVDRAAHGTARLLDSFRQERIWLPSTDVQQAVVQRAAEKEDRLDSLHDCGKQISIRLGEYCDAVIAEAMTGQLDIRVSEAEMAERAEAALESAAAPA